MNQANPEEANKELLRRLIEEGFNKGDLSIVDEVVAPDSREYQRGNHDGTEGTKEVIKTLRRWFPDFNMQIQDMVTASDTVWARFRATGTNLGSVMHRPPTGKKMSIDVIDIVRIKNGKVVEHWGVPDQLGMMLQLGLVGNQ
jgi:predicted ester cyclase